MPTPKQYTMEEIHQILSDLDNGISEPCVERMTRIKLPIPKEYGGGWATGSTQEEAVRHLLERVGSLAKTATDAPTFRDCWERWILIKMGVNSFGENAVKSDPLSPCTVANYKRAAKNHLLPFFGDKSIREIKPDEIQLFFNGIMHLSKSYSNQCRTILKGIFNRAERMEYIQSNPMRFEYDKSKKVGKKVVLQDDGLVDVIGQIDKLNGPDYLYACFLCFTALRRGEILGLRWEDLDFEKQTINVRRNVIFPEGINDPIVKEPKDGSFGVVHLQSELLKRIRPYQSSTGWVIRGSRGEFEGPVSRSSFTKLWYRIKRTVDLRGATSHCFRATYATMMNAHCDHIDIKALQGALRHKTPDLAIRVYTKENENKTHKAEMEYDEWIQSQLKQTS